MAELWLDNVRPKRRAGRRTRRKAKPRRNMGGLMTYMLNKKRKRRARRRTTSGRFSKAASTHRVRRRRRRGAAVRVRHVLNPRRRGRRRSRSGGGGVGMPGFLSKSFLFNTAFGAVGMVVPSLVTDRLLPMVGFSTSGIIRRAIQFAVPTAVLFLGGRRFLGSGTGAFAIGAYAVTALGLVNDLTGGLAMVSGGGMRKPLGRYEVAPRGLGAYERSPRGLGQGNGNGLMDQAATLYAY